MKYGKNTSIVITAAVILAIFSSIPLKAPPANAAACALTLNFSIKSGSPQTAGPLQYVLAAKDTGSADCSSASISVYYANDETFVSAAPKATAGGYYWRFGTLAPGEERDISLATTRSAALARGDVTNEACLSADGAEDACTHAAFGISQPEQTQPTASVLKLKRTQSTPPTAPNPAVTSFSPGSGQEYGVWIWTPPDAMTPQDMRNAVNAAAANHFNTIYLTLDRYLDIADDVPSQDKMAALAKFNQSVDAFLALAAQKGIAVDAEAGWRDWGETTNLHKAPRILVYTASYNQVHDNKFRGVQFDIEPYLLPQYASDKAGVLKNYILLVALLAELDKYEDLPMSVVVPPFYDSAMQWTPPVTVEGKTAYAYDHLIRLLGQLPHSRIILMAYRNFTDGNDGAIGLSEDEIREANRSNVKIIIAQETGPVSPSYVTFAGLSKSALFAQLDKIRQSFAQAKSFGGLAVDYLDPFLALPKS